VESILQITLCGCAKKLVMVAYGHYEIWRANYLRLVVQTRVPEVVGIFFSIYYSTISKTLHVKQTILAPLSGMLLCCEFVSHAILVEGDDIGRHCRSRI
jgi:hypothetical protein